MGTYTSLELRAKLRRDVSVEVIRLLESANNPRYDIEKYRPLPDHDLFRTPRWDWIVSSVGTNGDYDANGILVEFEGERFIERKCSLKNYDGEIEKFCDWLSPLVSCVEGEVLGTSRTEGVEGHDVVVFSGGKLVLAYSQPDPEYQPWS